MNKIVLAGIRLVLFGIGCFGADSVWAQPPGSVGRGTVGPPPTVRHPGRTPAPPATVDRVIIGATTGNPVQLLVSTLGTDNRIVDGKPVPIVLEFCDVDLDLTGHSIVIGSDRSLVAGAACARGPRTLGPRIFVRDNRGINSPLFDVRGDHILLAGFRLEGPTRDIGAGSGNLERAIYINPFEAAEPIRDIEVSNMEISHWSGAGVDVRDNTVQAERGRLFNTNIAAVRIRNNFIHHNRHGDGHGYGVEVAAGAYALIERNVFDENRHAIAGGSSDNKKDFTGYTVRDNLILPGGGTHCSEKWVFALLAWRFNCWQTHQIDMHGNKSSLTLGEWCCGTAGETLIIERNTVLYTSGKAIKVRGNPADKAVVDGNVFRHGSRWAAIAQNGEPGWGDNISRPIDVRPNNQFGVDPMTENATCNFAGPGQAERLVTTGATWWVFSPVTQQWRYLNTMPERMPALQLGDFDQDGTCDVARRSAQPTVVLRTYSKSGTGPWVTTRPVVDR